MTDERLCAGCGHTAGDHAIVKQEISGASFAIRGSCLNDTGGNELASVCLCDQFIPDMTARRPSKERMFMDMALVVARRSACKRLHVGAIITDYDMTQVISMGYNGPEKGGPNECRGQGEGNCGCLHAELNALVKAPHGQPSIMFCTHSPCLTCAGYMANSSVVRVVYHEKYRRDDGIILLRERNINVEPVQ